MNLLRDQSPYTFVPPKYATWFRPFTRILTPLSLRFQHKVSEVEVSGVEPVAQLAKEGHSVLVTPNHADHADPYLMLSIGLREGLPFHFMAAREGFEKSRLNAFVMKRVGAFSVNREGSDLAAVKTAIKILEEAKYPLVIFPEGEIYHHMETLDELNEGVSNIALRAASKLTDGRRAFVVPASIHLRYNEGVRDSFGSRLDALEERITIKPQSNLDTVDRILAFGSALLSIKEQEHLGRTSNGPLEDRLHALRASLVASVERSHGVDNHELSTPKRIKLIRAVIRKELTHQKNPPAAARAEELYAELDRVFLAHQLYSYPGIYLMERPSVDRIAETLFKLEEDVFGKGRYLGARKAEVVFGEPIDLGAFLSETGLNVKTGVGLLTEQVRERIQALLAG